MSEVFPATAVDGAAPGFVWAALRHARRPGPVLWVQDRLSLKETGRPYLAGLAEPAEVLHLTVSRAADVLWAMEQGLGCPGLAAVVGEVWGSAPALDFTATKRLALRAEAHGVPAWLIRRAAPADLSAARMRWRLASAPSAHHADDPRAPGSPRWTAELFRARSLRPGIWTVLHDAGAGQLSFTPAPAAAFPRQDAADPAGDAEAVPLRA